MTVTTTGIIMRIETLNISLHSLPQVQHARCTLGPANGWPAAGELAFD